MGKSAFTKSGFAGITPTRDLPSFSPSHTMSTTTQKKEFLSTIFRHLDGIATGPVAFALYQAGVLQHLADSDGADLLALTRQFKANEGYLNVALRVLCSQGWLVQTLNPDNDSVRVHLTSRGRIALRYVPLYEKAVKFIPYAIRMDDFVLNGFDAIGFATLRELLEGFYQQFDLLPSADPEEKAVQEQVLKHIEGLLAGPFVVSLGMNGLFNKYFSAAPFEVEEFSKHEEELRIVINFFTYLGWFTEENQVYNFTADGLFFAKRAGAYGVTVSYLPMFMRLKELIFGNPNVLWERPENSPEIHVNRRMNVWGSGAAHTGYFQKIDDIIVDLFNRPIHEQPKGFVDMGCGDGTLMAHIFDVIWTRTKRGKMLDEFPLFIIGADFNEAALSATRATLNQAGIWAKVVWGDIGKPELLAETVRTKYSIELNDLLHVRSFLDHNRIYEKPKQVDEKRASSSTGAFAHRGRRLPAREVQQNLVEHLKKWMPFVNRYGLLVIELHTIPPEVAAAHLGQTAVTAYDATHGFSDQYILEFDCFLTAAAEAGLRPDPAHQFIYPNALLGTVSINLLR